MATMKSDDFSQFLLKKGIRKDVVKKLLDENIDFDSLVDLNEEDLKSIDIKLGDRKRIMRIVKETKLSNESATAEAFGSNTINKKKPDPDITLIVPPPKKPPEVVKIEDEEFKPYDYSQSGCSQFSGKKNQKNDKSKKDLVAWAKQYYGKKRKRTFSLESSSSQESSSSSSSY